MQQIDKEELHIIFQNMKNNKNEFNKLYEKYEKLVYKIAFSILKNKEDSEDITQVVFTKIYEMPSQKLPMQGEASWLYTVTKNEAISHLRKTKENFDIDEVYNIAIEDEELNNLIEMDKYNRIIKGLNKKQQEIVSLKIIGQMSFNEIAKLLSTPIGTVQWHYYRALNILKIVVANLMAFIVTFAIYLRNRDVKKSANLSEIELGTKENIVIDISQTESTDIQNSEEDRIDDKSTQTKNSEAEITTSDEQKQELNNSAQNDEKVENIENEQSMINATLQNMETMSGSETKIQNDILFGVSMIFLVISIIFGIIYLKNKQSKHIKTSNK